MEDVWANNIVMSSLHCDVIYCDVKCLISHKELLSIALHEKVVRCG